MWLDSLDFWGRETLDNIKRNRLMSVVAITTVTIGLFILGAFFITISNVKEQTRAQTQKLDLVILLKRDVSPARKQQLLQAARMPQVAKADLVTGRQVFQEAENTEMLKGKLDDMEKLNPFADEIRIKLKDPQDLFKVRAYLTRLKGVDTARADAAADQAAKTLLAFYRFVTIAGWVALVILGIAILLIIHNAIRLTVYARRREIRIMHLVGATANFIRVPFLLEGVIYGAIGAALASLALGVLSGLARTSRIELVQSLAPAAGVFVSCTLLLMAAGVFFGLVGAALSFNHSQKTASV